MQRGPVSTFNRHDIYEQDTNNKIGIGAAVAKAFADAGCPRIAITDLNKKLLQDTKKAILESHPKAEVLAATGDISSENFVDSFIADVVRSFGRLDYCVNCAGILGNSQSSTETSADDFDRINNVNYRGCWFSSRAELRAMLRQEPFASHGGEKSQSKRKHRQYRKPASSRRPSDCT